MFVAYTHQLGTGWRYATDVPTFTTSSMFATSKYRLSVRNSASPVCVMAQPGGFDLTFSPENKIMLSSTKMNFLCF